MKRMELTLLFLVATSVVSLLQFHLDWFDEVRKNHSSISDAIANTMKGGPLFFFAIPVAVAAASEVWAHRRLRRDSLARWLSYFCVGPIVAMLFECFRVRYGATSPDKAY